MDMKAIVVSEFGDETVLVEQSISLPHPEQGEVRIKLFAAGVNPVETYIRSGDYPGLPSLPYTPGNDGAGVVDAVGEGVESLEKGERVFVAAALAKRNTGTYAEYVVCDASAVQALPDALSFEAGAGLGTPGLAAGDALFVRAAIKPGEIVLVHGASGGVGMLAVQLARRRGAIVFGTAGDREGLALVARLGAHRTFNHREEGYIDDIVAATHGRGVDAILETNAHINLMKDLSMTGHRGRIVVVGSRGTIEFDPRATMRTDTSVLGMGAANMSEAELSQVMHALGAALETGMEVVVDRAFALEDASKAHEAVTEHGKNGKIVLTIRHAPDTAD
ncbi:NADPH:quinone reductase [Raoultibacter phocaeensis]|uniref:NADPH:quinone reductase n=1 Tax=Raoultibacter phocaeensis TaxID=2479841 RepID=UPI002104C7CF|nr:NADPH:quinone reductase [Raoultibacter phocaeensis]